MEEIVGKLRSFFASGETLPLAWRKAQLEALRDMLTREGKALEAVLYEDLGKPSHEAWLTEIGFMLHEIGHILTHLPDWMKPRRVKTPLFLRPAKSRLCAIPRGLALIISPWNYPLQLTLSPLAASLAAGNVTLLKPSEHAPATSRWLHDNLPRYLDAQGVAVAEGGAQETQALLTHRFDIIFFTGSAQIARHIARAAAEHLTPTVLELGGKSPCVVMHTQQLETAARRIAFAKFINAGQTCVAPDYILVEEKLREDLIEALKRAIIQQFGPENAPHTMTRIIHRRHFERLDHLIGHGETCLFGGKRDIDSLRFSPTLIGLTDPSHPVMQEEIFGPILPILSLTSSDPMAEAISRIAAHPTPLACYLFSDAKQDYKRLQRLVQAGGMVHNDALMHLSNVHLPFGGIGTSGHGASHGEAGFCAFSHLQSNLLNTLSIDMPLRYPPYLPSTWRWLKRLMR